MKQLQVWVSIAIGVALYHFLLAPVFGASPDYDALGAALYWSGFTLLYARYLWGFQ